MRRVSKWADFPRRLLTGIVGVPLVIVLIAAGFPIFYLLALVIGLFTMQEYCRLVNPQNQLGWAIAHFLLIVCILCAFVNDYTLFFALCAAILVGGFIASALIHVGWEYFVPNYVYFVFGAIYIGLPLSMLLVIRGLPDGVWWVLMFMVTNWGTDTFALVGGRLFGVQKLAPAISPGKTVEGAIMGYLCGALGGFIISRFGNLPLEPTLMACATVPFFTILGDLFESWIKRRYHVKDSGNILPGHGGFLDRIDGILAAAPVFYLILMFFSSNQF